MRGVQRNPPKHLGDVVDYFVPGRLAGEVLADHEAPDGTRRKPPEEREVELPQLRVCRGGPGEFRFGRDDAVTTEEEIHLSVPVSCGVVELNPDPVLRGGESDGGRDGVLVADPEGLRPARTPLWDALRALCEDPHLPEIADLTGHRESGPPPRT